MTRGAADIAVTVGADVSPLQRGLREGAKSVRGFDQRVASMARGMAAAGIAFAAVGGAALALGRQAGGAAREIQNLSNLAGVSTTEFQRLAVAGETVGFTGEKMADIFKDVNDKFGDFLATGAGPLRDFFDNIAPKVGVTADQFAKLSGPEALQLYVTSLERAGVSQQQMTFYMEALANDATALLPLMRDNGKEMERLGREAERSGRIMGDLAVRDAAALDRKMTEIGGTIRDNLNRAIAENADEILYLAKVISEDWVDALIGVVKFIADVVGAVSTMIAKITSATKAVVDFIEKSNEARNNPVELRGSRRDRARGDEVLESIDTRTGPRTRARVIGTGSPVKAEAVDLAEVVVTGQPGIGSGRSGGGGGGGGRAGPSRDDFEAFAAQLATEAEHVEMWRQEQLEALEEFRKAKLGTEEEYNDAEARIAAEHAERLAEIERAAKEQRLNGIRGAFGDLATLMSSENEKIFKIGKAAAIAEATVSGYQAAVSAWEKGMAAGGPGLAAAFTAASLARTGALISGISSQSIGGGSSGGGGGFSGTATTTQAPLDVYLRGLGSNDIIRGADVADLLDRLQDEAGDRGYRLTFAQ